MTDQIKTVNIEQYNAGGFVPDNIQQLSDWRDTLLKGDSSAPTQAVFIVLDAVVRQKVDKITVQDLSNAIGSLFLITSAIKDGWSQIQPGCELSMTASLWAIGKLLTGLQEQYKGEFEISRAITDLQETASTIQESLKKLDHQES